jgi:hypothetical protein
MAPFFAIAEMIVAAAVAFGAFNSLRKRRVVAIWWIAFGLTAVVGMLVGAWFGFHFEYHLSPRVVVYSFPVPGAFHVLESNDDGIKQWVDFVTPAPMLSAVANSIFFPCMLVTLVWLTNTLSTCLGQSRECADLS